MTKKEKAKVIAKKCLKALAIGFGGCALTGVAGALYLRTKNSCREREITCNQSKSILYEMYEDGAGLRSMMYESYEKNRPITNTFEITDDDTGLSYSSEVTVKTECIGD